VSPGTRAAGEMHDGPRAGSGEPRSRRLSHAKFESPRRGAEPRPGFRRMGPPYGFLGMVGMVIALELAFHHTGRIGRCSSQLPLSWRQSSRVLASREARADIVCFGDSMVKLGVLPRVIERCLGLSTYNLAVLKGQPASSFFLFRRMLESGHCPRAVIVDFSAPLLTTPLEAGEECWAELAGYRDVIELAMEAGDPALGIMVASRWLIPSRSHHRICWPLAGADGSGQGGGVADVTARAFERNWRENLGAQVAPRQFVPIAGAVAEPPKPGEYQWRPRPVHVAYVARFLSLAMTHEVPVFWVVAPVIEARRERIESTGITAAYSAFVASFLTAYSGVTILDGQSLEWDLRAFRDPIHLNRDGAVALSLAIARVLRRRLDQGSPIDCPRWIRLSAPLEVFAEPWDRLVEDLEQSRQIVETRRDVATT
jgi:hypothetical protein